MILCLNVLIICILQFKLMVYNTIIILSAFGNLNVIKNIKNSDYSIKHVYLLFNKVNI